MLEASTTAIDGYVPHSNGSLVWRSVVYALSMSVFTYAILTLTTREREALLDGGAAKFLKEFLPHVARRHGAEILATGLAQDHVHLVLHLDAIVDIPRLVQGLKGASAWVANRDGVIANRKLRWAAGYDLRSVSPNRLTRTIPYVESQAHRHPRLVVADG